jgi:glutamate-ammonia-ligase adenylyltransferase
MLTSLQWRSEFAADIARHRLRLEQGAADTNIKRGPGGTLDIEFIVQMLQLRHAQAEPAVLVPGTLDALDRLEQTAFISREHAQTLSSNYRWLRRVESGLRLMNLPARHDLPSAIDQLDQLQFLLEPSTQQSPPPPAAPRAASSGNSGSSGEESLAMHPLRENCMRILWQNRQVFNDIFNADRA